jgi:hypothetical protein
MHLSVEKADFVPNRNGNGDLQAVTKLSQRDTGMNYVRYTALANIRRIIAATHRTKPGAAGVATIFYTTWEPQRNFPTLINVYIVNNHKQVGGTNGTQHDCSPSHGGRSQNE